MAEDITSLEIRVLSDQVEKADKRLKTLEATTGKSSKAIDRHEKDWRNQIKVMAAAGAAYISVSSAINGFRAVIQKTREFQVLRSALISSTGSVENMEKAWRGLLDFAGTTPYTLDQAVNGFNKLVNLGLNPSQRALTSYGDTAAAMGKDLSDMIEAVADATTGEFERLKEFGIKASTEGDKVTFTFRGVKTQIKKDAAAIEEYLIKLGENNFAGNMANRMETLDGKFSNLEDTWDTFLYNLGTSTGAADLFGGTLVWVAEKVAELDAYVSSGEMAKEIEGWTIATEGFRKAWADVLGYTTETNQESAQLSGSAWDEFMTDLQGIPPMVEAIVSEIATDFWSLVETAKAVGKAIADNFKGAFSIIKDSGKAYFDSLKDLGRGNVYEAVEGFKDRMAQVGADAAVRQNEIDTAFEDSIDAINENSAARLDAINQKLEDTIIRQQEAAATADLLRLNAENAATGLPDVDLGQFRITAAGAGQQPDGSLFPPGSGSPSPSPTFYGPAGLESTLLEAEQKIKDSFDRREQIVRDSGVESALAQAESDANSLTTLENSLTSENDSVREAYEERKRIILDATNKTEQEKATLMAEAHNAYIKALHEQQQATVDEYLDGAKGFFSDLASMGKAFGKTGFKIAQGAAIAEATINMYASAVAAYKSGAAISPILGPVFAAAALAAGAAQIANIKSQQYQGEYAHGGMISAGSFGMVGEAGPELVKGPALVTSARTTADHHNRPGSGKQVEIQIHNYSGERVETKTTEQDEKRLIEFIVGRAREEVANDLRKGGTPIAGAIESTYGVSRGRRVG